MTQYDLLQIMVEATSGYVKNELTSTECSNIMTRALNEYTEQLNIAGVSGLLFDFQEYVWKEDGTAIPDKCIKDYCNNR